MNGQPSTSSSSVTQFESIENDALDSNLLLVLAPIENNDDYLIVPLDDEINPVNDGDKKSHTLMITK